LANKILYLGIESKIIPSTIIPVHVEIWDY